jgi:hypothetical protein
MQRRDFLKPPADVVVRRPESQTPASAKLRQLLCDARPPLPMKTTPAVHPVRRLFRSTGVAI